MVKLENFGYSSHETSYPLEDDSAERASLIGAFQTVFNGDNSPYDENWDYETTDEFLSWTEERDYEGVLAIDQGRVAGFSWGYRIDPEDEGITDGEKPVEEKYPEELQELDQELFDGETFMIDEVGVLPDYRDNGLGTALESELLNKIDERQGISRVMQRTQWSDENQSKLKLDANLGFEPFSYFPNMDPYNQVEQPILEEVEFVGNEGKDERIYLFQSLEGEKPWK